MLVTSFRSFLILTAFLIFVGFFILRVYSALHPPPPLPRPAGAPTRLLIVLGSGGHTAELLSALAFLPTSRYTHRSYVVSSGDGFSAGKAAAFEERLRGLAELSRKPYGSFDVAEVPRARRVHQPLLTAPWTSLLCLLGCLRVLASMPDAYERQWRSYVSQVKSSSSSSSLSSKEDLKQREERGRRDVLRLGITPFPDAIVTNGPATGLVVVLAAVLLRALGLGTPRAADGGGGMRALFVESWARVRGLSLSGRILVASGACQRVLVQWQGLRERVGKSVEYVGPLVR